MDLSEKTKPQRTSIDLSAAVPTTVVNPLVVDDRTAKYSFALGEDTPPELRQIVQSGDESNLRANVSAKDVLHRQEQALALFPGAMEGVTGIGMGDREYALAAASVTATHPSVVLEDKYAEKAVNTIQSMSQNGEQQTEEANAPVEAETAYRVAQDHIAKKEIAMKLAQDQSIKVGAMGWGSYLFYTAGQMAPSLQWANYASYDRGYHWETQGGARLSKIKQLYSLSPYQFYIEANKEIDRLAETNALDAAQFAQDLTLYGAQSAAVDTAFGLVDVPFVGAGKLLVKAPKTVARMKEIAKAVSQPVTTIPDVLANVGHIEDSVEASAREVVAKASLPKEAGKDEVIEMSNLIRQTPSQWNPKLFVKETGKYSLLATERLVTIHNDIINKLAKATSGVLRAATLPQDALDTAMDLALEGYKKTYNKYADNILNVTRILPDETGTGTAKLQIDWGKDGGRNAFITEGAAKQAMYRRYKLASPPSIQRRIEESSGSGLTLQYPNYSSFKKAMLDSGIPEKEIIKQTGIRNEKEFLKLRDKEINQYVEEPVQPLVRKIYAEGGSPYSSNAFGPGRKGVDYEDSSGAKKFMELINYKPYEPAAEIVKLGEESYVIRQTINVAENDPTVFAKLLSPDNVSGKTTWAQFKQYAAGAKEVVSDFQAQQRAAVSHGTTYMGELIADVLRPAFGKLSKKEFDDLDKIMVTNRDGLRNPEDPTTRGMFYDNTSELTQAYMTHLQRAPSEAEVQAYFAVRTLSDFDWKMRSLQSFKAKARWGAQNHEIRVFNKETKKEFPTVVEAKRIDQLPGNSKNDANVLIITDSPNKMEQGVFQLSELVSEVHKSKVAELTDPAKGKYTVLHVYDAQNRALNEATGFHQPIHYVVVKESRPTALKLENQVPYAPGFHVEYKENWFLKAAQFAWNKGRRAFTGDVTLLGIRTEKEGRQLLSALEEARKLRKAKSAQFRSYLEKNTPFTLQEFENMLKATGEDAPFTLARNGKTSADGSSVTHDGRNIGQVYGEFDNLVNSPHNPAINANMEFLGEKDPMLKRAINEGTEMDPVWKLGNAEMYNPMETQTRAMGRLIRSAGYEDYQFGAVNAFIEEWGVRRGALKFGGETVTQDMLYRNPMYYFKHSEVVHPDKNIQAAARANKQAIEDLMGYPSETAMSIDDFRLKLQEGILGGKHVPDKIMPFLKDPFTYARAAVSHMKLGLFNPVQLFLQQATHANIILISPKAGLKQIPATIMMRLLSLTEDPKIIEHFAERNAGFGWNKKMFVESLEGYKRSGFGKIGGEYAWRNDVADPKFFKGIFGKFLDKGYLFFNHAEQNVRLAAWNTAYLEHLDKTGKSAGTLKDVDLRKILVRAQDLSGNMTRDASAFWQRGALGSVTQFYAYTARITELLIGKRLSRSEKLRLGGGLAVLYGFPALAGLGYLAETGDVRGAIAAMNPFDEDLRTYALENGIAIDGTVWGMINNGLASSLLYFATGEHFDVASRYSPYTLDITSNIGRNFDQHNPALAILLSAMGASGSVARDVLSSTYPIAEDMYQMLGEGGSTQLLMDDIMNAAREISSANVLYKINQAINGQLYLSKKGTLISDQSKENASLKIIEALGGLQTYDETDTFRMIWSNKESAQIKKDTLKTLQKYGNYYMQALRAGQDTRPYMMRIEATLALIEDPVERSNVFRDIFSQKELQEGVWNAFTKNGSLEQRNKRKAMQLQKQKEQQ